jgi:hypothetical protein
MSKAKMASLKAHKSAGESRKRASDIKSMLQTAEDEKNQPKLDEAYEKARTTFKAGGYVKAADGCAKKGKTKGKMV